MDSGYIFNQKAVDGMAGNMLARPKYKVVEDIREGIITPREFLDEGMDELWQRHREINGIVSEDRAFRTFETRYVEIIEENLQSSGCDCEFYIESLDELYEADNGLAERRQLLHDKHFAEDDGSNDLGVIPFDSPPIFSQLDFDSNTHSDKGVV